MRIVFHIRKPLGPSFKNKKQIQIVYHVVHMDKRILFVACRF